MYPNFVIRDHELHCNSCDENLAPGELNQLAFLFHLVAGHELEAGQPSTMPEIVEQSLLRCGLVGSIGGTVRIGKPVLQ